VSVSEISAQKQSLKLNGRGTSIHAGVQFLTYYCDSELKLSERMVLYTVRLCLSVFKVIFTSLNGRCDSFSESVY